MKGRKGEKEKILIFFPQLKRIPYANYIPMVEWNTRIISILFVATHAYLMTAFDDNSIFKKGLVDPFGLLRLTSSNDSLMNGQEGTGRGPPGSADN